jgi:Ala-tRNA(Pro) deacylase
MAIPETVKDYLSNKGVPYWHHVHAMAYTSQEVAEAVHVRGREFAKAVLLRADGRLIIAALPAGFAVDMRRLKMLIGAKRLNLAFEREFMWYFPGCQPGAMPPLGKLSGLPLYCDRLLTKQPEIEFNAGTHTDTIRMRTSEFLRVERPVILQFAQKYRKPVSRAA